MLSHACTRPECQESIAVINAKGFDYLAGSVGSVLETCELSHAYTCPVCGVRRRGSVLDTCVRAITRIDLSCVTGGVSVGGCVGGGQCWTHAYHHTRSFILCVKSVLRGSLFTACVIFLFFSFPMASVWTHVCYGTQTDAHTYTHTHQPYTP